MRKWGSYPLAMIYQPDRGIDARASSASATFRVAGVSLERFTVGYAGISSAELSWSIARPTFAQMWQGRHFTLPREQSNEEFFAGNAQINNPFFIYAKQGVRHWSPTSKTGCGRFNSSAERFSQLGAEIISRIEGLSAKSK